MTLLKSLFLLVLMCPLFCFGQKNYKPGYVVNIKGDTLNGFVDSRDLHGQPKHINLKLHADSNPTVLTPQNTQNVAVNGQSIYQRYAGPITLDNISDQWVSNGRDTSMRLDTVFLKVLIKGPYISLYSFSDDRKTRFYITEKDGEMPVELGYRIYYDSGKVDIFKDHGRTVNENTYMIQLFSIANKHNLVTPSLQYEIEWCRYAKSYLQEIVNEINGFKK